MPITVPPYPNIFALLSGNQPASKIDDDFATIRNAVNGVALNAADIPSLVAIPASHGIFDAITFGATGNGVTDDTTAIQAAITAAQAVGGIVFLPAGRYKITSALSITAGVTITGCGAQSLHDTHSAVASGSVLFTTSTTINVISVNTTEAVHFRDFTVVGSTSASAGAGITVTGGTVDSISGCQRPTFARLTFEGFFYGIQLVSAVFANIQACVFESYQQAGVSIQNTGNDDNGDNTIYGCVFSGATTGTIAGILWQSGGGLYLAHNKFLGNNTGISISHNLTTATLDFTIVGNSIENFGGHGILISSLSTGTLQNFTIIGNQIAASVASTDCINMSAAAGAILAGITIQGNVLTGTASSNGIVVGVRTDLFVISGNTLNTFGNGFSFNTVGAGVVTDHKFSTVTTAYNFTAAAAVRLTELGAIFTVGTLFAVANGSLIYCTDGKNTQDAGYADGFIQAAGTGNITKRVGGNFLNK